MRQERLLVIQLKLVWWVSVSLWATNTNSPSPAADEPDDWPGVANQKEVLGCFNKWKQASADNRLMFLLLVAKRGR